MLIPAYTLTLSYTDLAHQLHVLSSFIYYSHFHVANMLVSAYTLPHTDLAQLTPRFESSFIPQIIYAQHGRHMQANDEGSR